jgi:F-type H+-transporting ATPase subunit alpha
VDESTYTQLRRGERELAVLRQDAHTPLPLEREIMVLYAVVHGYGDDIPLERIKAFEQELIDYMERQHPEVPAAIRETRDLAGDTEERLRGALAAFHDGFVARTPVAEKESA